MKLSKGFLCIWLGKIKSKKIIKMQGMEIKQLNFPAESSKRIIFVIRNDDVERIVGNFRMSNNNGINKKDVSMCLESLAFFFFTKWEKEEKKKSF